MKLRLLALLPLALATACTRGSTLEAGGVYTVRSACPLVGVPAATGDITLFNPPSSRDAAAIDVTATMTNVFGNCDDTTGDRILSNIGFTVVAVRSQAGPARQVVLPFFDVVVQGGTSVVSKRVGQVALNFAEGSLRAETTGQAVARVSRAAATLPEDVRRTLTRPRKAGQAEAAVDPLSDPTIRAAVARSTFEHMVGFQLTSEQLRYNATR